jgi:sugar phosphate permease
MAAPLTESRVTNAAQDVAVNGERSRRRWSLLAAAMVIVGVAMGALFSLGVFLEPIQVATKWSRADVSAVALLAWVTLGIGSFAWGAVSDRTGPRVVIVVGGLFLGLGLVLSSRAVSLWQFGLAYGGLVGLAVGAFYAPLTCPSPKSVGNTNALRPRSPAAGPRPHDVSPQPRTLEPCWSRRHSIRWCPQEATACHAGSLL